MGFCIINRRGLSFKAYIQVNATANCTVTVTGAGQTYSKSSGSSGVVTFEVKKKGTYTITSNASGSRTSTVTVIERKETYHANVTSSFTLSIAQKKVNGTAFASISVSRSSSPQGGAATGALSNGAIVYAGDVLTATATAATGFESPSVTTSGGITKSGNNYVVSGDCTLTGTASPKKFTLTISNATINKKQASTITVKRTSSPYAGASTSSSWTATASNALYHGDVISVSVTTTTPYNSPTVKVNNSAVTSYTVNNGAVTAAATTTVKSFTITLSKGGNTSLSLKKSASDYAGSGVNSTYTSNFTAYYGDKFVVTASASTNYNLSSLKWGSSNISSGSTQTATGAVTVTTAATPKTITLYCHFGGSGSGSNDGQANLTVPVGWTMAQIAANSTYNHATMFSHAGNVVAGALYVTVSGTNVYLQVPRSKGTLRTRAKWLKGKDVSGNVWTAPTDVSSSGTIALSTHVTVNAKMQLYT